MSADVLVVGGGIVGCACAYFLAQEGLSVSVVEPGPIGGGATAAGMGHIVVMDDSEAQFALTHYSQRLWQEIYCQLPRAAELRVTGTLWVASDAEEFSHAMVKKVFYADRDVTAEVLDSKATLAAEPNLLPGIAGALRVPHDSVVFPMVAARWMLDSSRAPIVHARAAALSSRSVTLEDGTKLEAGFVVNAAGGHAPSLTPGLPIEPRKGHLAITDRYPGWLNHQVVELGYLKSAHNLGEDSVAFNVQPRATDQILIGSSRQFADWNEVTDRTVLAKMIRRAIGFMPGLSELSVIRTWVGFRAATPDKLPLIGRVDSGVLVAAGHEGLGITTSTATGKLVADIILDRPSQIDRAPYSPSRVGGHP